MHLLCSMNLHDFYKQLSIYHLSTFFLLVNAFTISVYNIYLCFILNWLCEVICIIYVSRFLYFFLHLLLD